MHDEADEVALQILSDMLRVSAQAKFLQVWPRSEEAGQARQVENNARIVIVLKADKVMLHAERVASRVSAVRFQMTEQFEVQVDAGVVQRCSFQLL